MASLYHANFRTSDPRPGRAQKSFTFYAASDGAAAAVAAELANWNVGQLTSLTKNVGGQGRATTYPTGTRISAAGILADASFSDWRVQVRDVTQIIGAADAVSAWLSGAAFVAAPFTIVALGAPPTLPNSGNPVSIVKAVSVTTKY